MRSERKNKYVRYVMINKKIKGTNHVCSLHDCYNNDHDDTTDVGKKNIKHSITKRLFINYPLSSLPITDIIINNMNQIHHNYTFINSF